MRLIGFLTAVGPLILIWAGRTMADNRLLRRSILSTRDISVPENCQIPKEVTNAINQACDLIDYACPSYEFILRCDMGKGYSCQMDQQAVDNYCDKVSHPAIVPADCQIPLIATESIGKLCITPEFCSELSQLLVCGGPKRKCHLSQPAVDEFCNNQRQAALDAITQQQEQAEYNAIRQQLQGLNVPLDCEKTNTDLRLLGDQCGELRGCTEDITKASILYCNNDTPSRCATNQDLINTACEDGKQCSSRTQCPFTNRCHSNGQCSIVAFINDLECGNDDDCYTNFCDPTSKTCQIPTGQAGANCINDVDCIGGLVCTIPDIYRIGGPLCLPRPPDGAVGAQCRSNADCNPPYECTRTINGGGIAVFGGKVVCAEALRRCNVRGESCFRDSSCCSGKCASGFPGPVCVD